MNREFNREGDLSDKDFALFKKYIYDKVGIDIEDHKRELLRNRLKKRLKALNIPSFTGYYEFLRRSGDELGYFISAVTTNITSFFREPKQWEFLKANLKKYIDTKGDRSLKIWSAGCASGEEPYTAAIFLRELFGRDYSSYNFSILATDISEKALGKAKTGEYSENAVAGLAPSQLDAYFTKEVRGTEVVYKVNNNIRKSVNFGIFNLVYGNFTTAFPSADFDLIFCRNVMIYFDSAVKKALVERFISKLRPGGFMLVGHSESLMTFSDRLDARLHGIYRKK